MDLGCYNSIADEKGARLHKIINNSITFKRETMSLQETLEREFHTLLDECQRIHWKNLELDLLIQYANMEKKIWEDRNLDYAVNNMIKVIEMAESLYKLREETKTL